MPIVIKNADELVYSRFKAKAADRGLRIGEAITEAMNTWLERQSQQDLDQIIEERNEAAFRRIFPSLLKHHEGYWGLISNGDLIGVYPTKAECFEAVREKDLLYKPNLLFPVRKVVPRRITIGPYRRMTGAQEV